MSGQLAEVEARIETVHKLSAVIAAMRGIAVSRVQDAHRHLDAIRMYAATIGDAIGHAMSFPVTARLAGDRPPGGEIIVVFCAEQGFAGAFSEKVLTVARNAAGEVAGPVHMLMVGDRGLLAAQERRVTLDWTASMIAHPDRTAHLAGRIAQEIFERLATGGVTGVSLVHASPGGAEGYEVGVKRLVPFDYSRFPPPKSNVQPLLTLNPDDLLARLVDEYLFAEISEAVMLSFAAENEARMRAMIAAHDNVTRSLEDLVGESRRLRQDAITDEIMELATGSLTQL